MSHPHQRARQAALQILYFREVSGASPEDALSTFFTVHQPEAGQDVRAFAGELVRGTLAEQASLDALIGTHTAHWRIERLAVIDRLVLRMAAWELRHHAETPPPVVIDEAIELARRFSSEEAARFVNGVLDAIHRDAGVREG